MQVNCRTGVIESTRLLNLKQFIRLHGEITQQASMATMAPEGRERGICASMIIQEWVWAQKWGVLPDSKVCGASMGPTGPRWAPCWPHEPCYLGYSSVHYVFCYQYFWFNKMMCLNFQIIFMFEQCLCSITVVTPVKYESGIQYVNSAFMTLKNGFE